MENTMKNVADMSTKELEALLARKKKAEASKKQKAKEQYEENRDQTIEELYQEGLDLSLAMARFKNKMHQVMSNQSEALAEYGGIRSNSQGGFSITHSNQKQRITRRRDTDASWDERANKAVELIKDFLLSEGVKKSAGKIHGILMGFIERNAQGDLEYAKVMELLKHEGTFQDPRWVNGLQLIKEGYSITFKKFGYDLKEKTADGKWNRLELNFSSL